MNNGKPYALGGDEGWDRFMRARRAGVEAAFLLPYLEPGMSLVDVGCGQGTITAGLAQAVAPGLVRGIDAQAAHIEKATELAGREGLENLVFETGDVYDPPYEEGSFDIAFTNMVLMHLQDPERALQAMARLVKPGGLIATRERGSHAFGAGRNAKEAVRIIEVLHETVNATSKSPYGAGIGEVMNRLCREAGLEVIHLSGVMEMRTAESYGQKGSQVLLSGAAGQRAVEAGVATQDEVDELNEAVQSGWSTDPDAYVALDVYQVIARKR